MFKKLKCIAASVAVLLTATFAGINVSAEDAVATDEATGNVLQAGYLYETSYDVVGDQYDAINTSLESELVTAWKNHTVTLDVSKYNLTRPKISEQYFGILNEHPEMFYVENTIGRTYNKTTDIVSKITITYSYTKAQANSMTAEMNAVVNEILAGVDSSWTEAEKALYIHEYLTQTVAYTPGYYNMYDLLVNGIGVCQAYALTNDYILEKLGIESKVVTSDILDHAWNLVKIDGVWYYTDVTWDDPYPNIDGYSGHKNFLVSKEGLIETGHDSTDWMWVDANVYNTATGTKYDDIWDEFREPMYYSSGKWFWYSRDYLYLSDFANDVHGWVYEVEDYKWYVDGTSTYYTGVFPGGYFYDDKFIFASPYSINSIDLTGIDEYYNCPEPVSEYETLRDDGKCIYGFFVDTDGYVTIAFADDPYDENYVFDEFQLQENVRITSQPSDFTGKVGTTATFKVTATGATSYQWYQDSGNGWVAINTSAGRSATLSIPVTAARDGYKYCCVVSNASNSVVSNAATLHVKQTLAYTSQPVNYTGKAGETAVFTVKATGATSYQWYQNTGNGWVAINTSAGRSNTLSLPITAARTAYKYRCMISDGTTKLYSNTVKMILSEQLKITAQPVNFVGEVGDTAKFTIGATGVTSYQWYQNTGNGWVAMNTSAGRSSTISIAVAQFRVGFQYKCVISDGTNTLTSNVVSIKLNEVLGITSQPVDYYGAIGDTAKFTIGATGVKYYQWQQNTGSGWVNINTAAGRSNTISIALAEFRVGYQYRCMISDGTNLIASNAAMLGLDGTLSILSQPTDYVGTIGGNAVFTIKASGVKYYQWQQNTGSGWVNIDTAAGRSNTITIPVAAFRVGYQYRCMISDGTNLIASDAATLLI